MSLSTRLSRNCSDWYPLLDVCGYKSCLIADRDSLYDPSSTNGRLLLGLKGQLAEVELSTIRARLSAGILNKAQRGELIRKLPVGFISDELTQVHKDPNQEIQDRLALLFETFLRLKSAAKVLRYCAEHHLGIPRYDRFGDLIWTPPTISRITAILKNPADAGTYAYGRSKQTRHGPGPRDFTVKTLPMDQWNIVIHTKYPAYISWELFENIQRMLKDNYAEYDRNKTRGIPRRGAALLQGLVYCGECGHKMVVQYKKAQPLHLQLSAPAARHTRLSIYSGRSGRSAGHGSIF